MTRSIIPSTLFAVALLLGAGLSLADESKPATAAESKAISGAKAKEKSARPAKKAAAKVKLVDINSASKAELRRLPGINDTEADKIIAGRPYLTKAHLATHNIISGGEYERLKEMVIAKPNPATAEKLKEMEKNKRH